MNRIIDWYKIEKQNPKSYKEFSKWDAKKNEGFLEYINQRDLFEFFDERDLFIQINFSKGRFGYIIKSSFLDIDIINKFNYLHRVESEIIAFENCFNILENLIDKKQNIISLNGINK